MDQTFMTIHNLSPDANILFASESVSDILGYQPSEVQGKPAFEYFHPEEVPFARLVHSQGILLDKAAVLHYARIRSRDGQWMGCECCFTIVHDVLVACTSIYKRGEKSERRAIEAPQIRRIFSSSPRDPRYNMLEHLSPKFKMPPMEREPRAALILNRFTRTLSVMFATTATSQLLGLSPEEIKDKSFYECIQENCLDNAFRCLESAKANDSIAYLRFWYRDPRRDDDFEPAENEEEDTDMTSPGMAADRGVGLGGRLNNDDDDDGMDLGEEADIKEESMGGCSDVAVPFNTSPRATAPRSGRPIPPRCRRREPAPSFELEAVVSCTSDGLVVVLRKARPPIPAPHPPLLSPFHFENGLFAAPWGQQPIRPYYPPDMLYTFQPPLLPQYMPLRENVKAAGGPPLDQLMRSIQDVAVFAWALVGINGNLAGYARGLPGAGAQPPQDGPVQPLWDPGAGTGTGPGPGPYPGAETHATAALRWGQQESSRKLSTGSVAAITASTATAAPAYPSGPAYPSETIQATGPPPPASAAAGFSRPLPPATRDAAGYGATLSNITPSWPVASCSSATSTSATSSPFEQQSSARQSPASTHANYGQAHEPWVEASRSYTPATSYPISASSPPSGSTDQSQSFRPWQ